jgi:hypothetical protein
MEQHSGGISSGVTRKEYRLYLPWSLNSGGVCISEICQVFWNCSRILMPACGLFKVARGDSDVDEEVQDLQERIEFNQPVEEQQGSQDGN